MFDSLFLQLYFFVADPDHFVDVTKMVKTGSGSERQQDDIMLTRYAGMGR